MTNENIIPRGKIVITSRVQSISMYDKEKDNNMTLFFRRRFGGNPTETYPPGQCL